MNEDEKRRFDAIMELCKMPWDRISERKKYEWRIAFAIWSAVGLLIVSMLSGRFTQILPKLNTGSLAVGIVIAGIIICVVQEEWLRLLQQSYRNDHKIAEADEKELRIISNNPFSKELQDLLDEWRITRGNRITKVLMLFHVYITFLLFVLATIIATRL